MFFLTAPFTFSIGKTFASAASGFLQTYLLQFVCDNDDVNNLIHDYYFFIQIDDYNIEVHPYIICSE